MKKTGYIFFGIILFCFSVRANNADTIRLKQHLEKIIKTRGPRNYINTAALDSVAKYIYSQLNLYADSVHYQEYRVGLKTYKNVIGRFFSKKEKTIMLGPHYKEKTIVVGAHYDVCENQDGADDNASGVAGLLELARLLKGSELNYSIELVAYSLEEPPFFRTEQMGSYVHARSLYRKGVPVYGMISLEMIGFFKDERKTQSYPLGFLKLFYGSRGNYITLVNKNFPGKFCRKFSKQFIQSKCIRTKKFSGPKFLPGVDFSDHLNYWKFGYRALMITDTSFYRNKNYHESTDTIETLDLKRMAKVTEAVFIGLTGLK
ncbi:MAG TPA: M28 family peptidase [Bacteroidia bacterium]|jgi:hypothetical protein|nr:M28 family peptidase [Bacteroidia bacterium]